MSRPWKVGEIVAQQSRVNDRRALITGTEFLFSQDGPIRWVSISGFYASKTQAELESEGWRLLEDLPVEP